MSINAYRIPGYELTWMWKTNLETVRTMIYFHVCVFHVYVIFRRVSINMCELQNVILIHSQVRYIIVVTIYLLLLGICCYYLYVVIIYLLSTIYLLSIYLSIYQPIYLSIYLSIYLYIYMCVCSCVHQFVMITT